MTSDFERKLASMQPRQEREIELPVVTKNTPKASCNHRSRKRLQIPPVGAALAGFLLGVIATYTAMTYCPVQRPEEPETVIVTPILDEATIASLRRPLDLRQLATVRVVKEQPTVSLPENEFQYRTLMLREIERQKRK